VRPVKLDFFDHPFTCPICKASIVYTSMHTVIVSSQRKCPSCKGELMIEQGVARAISDKKPPKREALPTAKRSRK
jgi:competence CoiA-like predicted nuclease